MQDPEEFEVHINPLQVEEACGEWCHIYSNTGNQQTWPLPTECQECDSSPATADGAPTDFGYLPAAQLSLPESRQFGSLNYSMDSKPLLTM